MTSEELTAAVEAWALETLPELATYPFHPSKKDQPFPDIAIEVDDISTGYTPGEVGLEGPGGGSGWQQVMFRAWLINLLLMVDPTDPAAAETQLKGFSDSLQNSVLADNSLGGRVQWTNRKMRSTFTPPFVKFDDGSRGRLVTVSITVGATVEYDE